MNSLSISRQCCRHLHLNVETEYLWDSLALISDQPTGVGEHVLMFFSACGSDSDVHTWILCADLFTCVEISFWPIFLDCKELHWGK